MTSPIRRREAIALLGSATAWPLAARAQQPNRPSKVAYLAPAPNQRLIDAFTRGLRDLGYVEGRNLTIEYRFADGPLGQLDGIAGDVAQLAPDVIVAVGVAAAVPAKRATSTIPIVMAPTGDPVQTGIVPSLASPGGNITGVSLYASELNQKRLEILTEAFAGVKRVAVLSNANNPLSIVYWQDIQAAGEKLRLELRRLLAAGVEGLEAVASEIRREPFGALTVLPDAEFDSGRARIVALAAELRLPAIYEHRAFTDAGGLMSYGPNVLDMSYRAAAYVDKILKGARPADLPIEQPTRFELIVNLKTAKTLGLDLPPTLVSRADEVIE